MASLPNSDLQCCLRAQLLPYCVLDPLLHRVGINSDADIFAQAVDAPIAGDGRNRSAV